MKESVYQSNLIKKLEALSPNCIIMKNDANYRQGFPDLTVFFDCGVVAILEVKNDEHAPHQPNQDYYIEFFRSNGYISKFVYPQNEEEVLNDIREALRARRSTCIS